MINALHKTIYTLPLSLVVFMFACTLYAFWGSPTPDTPGIAEALIGVTLIIAARAKGLKNSYNLSQTAPTDNSTLNNALRILFLYGLLCPLMIGVGQSNDVSLILRDILPFLFLCTPLFLEHNFQNSRARIICLSAIFLIALCFALRSLWGSFNIALSILSFEKPSELTYLANSPLILFCFVFSALQGLSLIIQQPKKLRQSLSLLLISVICFIPLVMTVQRASIAYAVLAVFCGTCFMVYQNPKHTLWIIIGFGALAIVFHTDIMSVTEQLIQKTQLVGFNNRFAEWAAVWERLSASPLSVLFGGGWGATYHSPAVGGLEVNFTHSLLSSMLLKSGIIGCGLTLIYITHILKNLLSQISTKPFFVLASLGPLLIPVILYASYKSLDFGILLLFLSISSSSIALKIEST